MIENGSSGGVRPLQQREFHDEFLELCAIATTGSLSARDRKRLEEHLSKCSTCREAMTQYESLIAQVIPAMAPESTQIEAAEDSEDWSLSRAEVALFERLNREGRASDNQRGRDESLVAEHDPQIGGSHAEGETLWRHMWWQYAAGLLLISTLAASLYQIGVRRGVESEQRASMPTQPTGSQPQPRDAGLRDAGQKEEPDHRHVQPVPNDALISELRAQLAGRTAEFANLQAQEAQLRKNLNDRESDQTRLTQAHAELTQQLTVAQTDLQTVQQRLDAVTAQHSQELTRVADLQSRIGELTDSAHEKDEEVAREKELLDHDRDIRDLMGSRDLYIAEVYDVAKTGDTLKPFGRVFYTKGKSLIFYAYDLDQQTGLRNANTFQAWGRRGPDRQQAVNLGIFYQDNSGKKRWVVKSTNPKTLAQIDAVFVTVEPNGGSSHPSTKPLLFAYLRVEPNHP